MNIAAIAAFASYQTERTRTNTISMISVRLSGEKLCRWLQEEQKKETAEL